MCPASSASFRPSATLLRPVDLEQARAQPRHNGRRGAHVLAGSRVVRKTRHAALTLSVTVLEKLVAVCLLYCLLVFSILSSCFHRLSFYSSSRDAIFLARTLPLSKLSIAELPNIFLHSRARNGENLN